jgi:hypothetical protein
MNHKGETTMRTYGPKCETCEWLADQCADYPGMTESRLRDLETYQRRHLAGPSHTTGAK